MGDSKKDLRLRKFTQTVVPEEKALSNGYEQNVKFYVCPVEPIWPAPVVCSRHHVIHLSRAAKSCAPTSPTSIYERHGDKKNSYGEMKDSRVNSGDTSDENKKENSELSSLYMLHHSIPMIQNVKKKNTPRKISNKKPFSVVLREKASMRVRPLRLVDMAGNDSRHSDQPLFRHVLTHLYEASSH
ncbi:predicted protein [Nematostella vectensis]|uniref:Uncharacterized protein n=1 Tax=Nematostella vectensis TaxID=45351 RepID=A7RTZ0_NEMVE|nr:predicted protein [Nematostella vectensis]|eukprot:XP_001637233.1 predicted protein [Nematostella vectensis]